MRKTLLLFMLSLPFVVTSCFDDEDELENYCYKIEVWNSLNDRYYICDNCGKETTEKAEKCSACHCYFNGITVKKIIDLK
ncbi:MAG: hypothetical protein MJZ19_00545 [Paludibacteraceae bacterium]|nr:hypothetical protein [Paludibacteraceae bacterium]